MVQAVPALSSETQTCLQFGAILRLSCGNLGVHGLGYPVESFVCRHSAATHFSHLPQTASPQSIGRQNTETERLRTQMPAGFPECKLNSKARPAAKGNG